MGNVRRVGTENGLHVRHCAVFAGGDKCSCYDGKVECQDCGFPVAVNEACVCEAFGLTEEWSDE